MGRRTPLGFCLGDRLEAGSALGLDRDFVRAGFRLGLVTGTGSDLFGDRRLEARLSSVQLEGWEIGSGLAARLAAQLD